jgi:Icc-related predicted phosphoesterase
MAETPKKKKIMSAFVIFLAFGVIGAAVFSHIENKFGGSEKEEVEVKVTKESSEQESSLADIILNEATEENIEQDASSLEINAEKSANEETEDQPDEEFADIQSPSPSIEPKMKKEGELKIGFVTDIHAKSHSISDEGEARVLKPFFVNGINYFLDRMDSDFKPDFIIANGDLIEGTGRSIDIGKEEVSLIRSLFERTAIPKYWVVGNHDLRSIDKKQWKKALGIDYLHESFEVGDYKIIILDSNFDAKDNDIVPEVYYTRGHVSEKEIIWLEKELESTDKDVIVFIHHPPLWNVDLKGNGSLLSNSQVLQNLFSKYNVLAVFGGHLEDIFIDKKGGTKYFVLPGFTKKAKYQKTFSEITIKKGKISIDMSYLADEEKYRTVRITEED